MTDPSKRPLIHPWKKSIVEWIEEKAGDTLCISVPFTWLMSKARDRAAEHNGPVVIGGPGTMKPTTYNEFEPVLLHNSSATFTTRGCPNKCKFCAVPKLEGRFREIKDFRPAPLVCDNNLTAASEVHINRVVERLKVFPVVDFNQGLEARKFTLWMADALGKLNCKVRFAFDRIKDENSLKNAIDLCRSRTTKNIGVYVLIGFKDTPEDARYRLEMLRKWGVMPFPMRFQALNAVKKHDYVAPGWTDFELKRMVRYYANLRYTSSIPYNEFRGVGGLLPDKPIKIISRRAVKEGC